MLEKVLIVILVLLAGALLSHILWRKRQERGNIRLKEAAVKDLMTAMQNNIKFGRIQEVAGKVSHILKEYLGCDRILFIKYYRGFLEVNYYHGLQNPDRERLRIRLTPELQSKFKSFQTASRLEALTAAISKEYIDRLRNLGLSYFFPVYLRDNLYGVYFIKTDLTPETSSLNFLSAALAYSLSTAYHIGVQEQQIKKFEGKIQQLSSAKPKIPSSGLQQSGEYARFLKIKNSKQLIPELLTALRKECDFSKMAFYLESENSGDALIAINWNLEPEVDKIFTDLEDYLNYCRDNMLRYDERDLYKTDQWRKFEKHRNRMLKEAQNG